MWTLIGVLAILAVVCWIVSTSNKLRKLSREVDETTAEVYRLLRERWDLISDLVETVRGYAPDKTALYTRAMTAVLVARTAGGVLDVPEREVQAVLVQLFATGRSFPQARENEHFARLQVLFGERWTAVERAQRAHSNAVRSCNAAVDSWPASIVARRMGLRRVCPILGDLATARNP
ncbi:MAG: LemA family protein [Candidatus Pacebacteria bacterium]|nr:LemA family protein [Candidatus Paceibacterota bacterium]